MTLAKVRGFDLSSLNNIGSMAIGRILLRERLLKFRELELLSLAAYNECSKATVDSIMEETYKLLFPWVEEEKAKKDQNSLEKLRKQFSELKEKKVIK